MDPTLCVPPHALFYLSESISAAKDLATILTQKWQNLIAQEQKRPDDGAF